MNCKKMIALLMSSVISVCLLGPSTAIAVSELGSIRTIKLAPLRHTSTVTTSADGTASPAPVASVRTVTADSSFVRTPELPVKSADEISTYTAPTLYGVSPEEIYVGEGESKTVYLDLSSGINVDYKVTGYDELLISVTKYPDHIDVNGNYSGDTTMTVTDRYGNAFDVEVHVMALEMPVTSLPGEISVSPKYLDLQYGDYYSQSTGYIDISYMYSSVSDPVPYISYDPYYVDVVMESSERLKVVAKNAGNTTITVAYNEYTTPYTVNVSISHISTVQETTTTVPPHMYYYELNDYTIDLDAAPGYYYADENALDTGQILSCKMDLEITQKDRYYPESSTFYDTIDITDCVGLNSSPNLLFNDNKFSFVVALVYNKDVVYNASIWDGYSSYSDTITVAKAGAPVLDSSGDPVTLTVGIGYAGDVDHNGSVNALDSAYVLNYYSNVMTGGKPDDIYLQPNEHFNNYEDLFAFLADVSQREDDEVDHLLSKSHRCLDAVDAQYIMDISADNAKYNYTEIGGYSESRGSAYSVEEIEASKYKPELIIRGEELIASSSFDATVYAELLSNGCPYNAFSFYLKFDDDLQIELDKNGDPEVSVNGNFDIVRTRLLPGNIVFVTACGLRNLNDMLFAFNVTGNFSFSHYDRGYPVTVVYPNYNQVSSLFRSVKNTEADALAEAWLFTRGVTNGKVNVSQPTITTTTSTSNTTSTRKTTTTTTTTVTATYPPTTTRNPGTTLPSLFIDKVVPQSLTMTVGESQQATIIWSDLSDARYNMNNGFNSNVRVNWSVSDPRIVSVDETGKITALAPGTARITFYSSYPRLDTPDSTVTINVTEKVQPAVTTGGQSVTTATASTAPAVTTTAATREPSAAELRDLAKRDYKEKTGIYPESATSEYLDNGLLEIKLFDRSGVLLETYTVDPSTGVGLTASGNGVKLPQTGNNDPMDISLALAAVALMLSGSVMVCLSRRRKS